MTFAELENLARIGKLKKERTRRTRSLSPRSGKRAIARRTGRWSSRRFP